MSENQNTTNVVTPKSPSPKKNSKKVRKIVSKTISEENTQKTGKKVALAGRTVRSPFTIDPKKYDDFNDRFSPESDPTPNTAHTTAEFVAMLEKHKDVEVDARVLSYSRSKERFKVKRISTREAFLSQLKQTDEAFRLRERANNKKPLVEFDDWFAADVGGRGGIENTSDFTPLLGGPFFKQLYQYDYMKMHSACFYAWHHDPFAKYIVETITDFVVGKGFKVESEDDESQLAWDIFEKANKFQKRAKSFVREMNVFGEQMLWFLPGTNSKIAFKPLAPGQPKTGEIKRVRLMDPSVIWDICTMPDDIEDVLFYQWIAPTQYQTYTKPGVPSTKFIFQQIPADQVLHYKINASDGEKRGRSDLFAVLGYLKRLRDSIDYKIISENKAAAWSIDTTIEGNQEDLEAYADSQRALGTIPPAGSEFIHTKAVTRQYLQNSASGSGTSDTFSWVLSCLAAGVRLPVSYFGSHLSGGQTRASAIVSTEPVAKLFESRRELLTQMIQDVHYRITGKECRVTLPELITQDRSQKIRDVISAEQSGYISKRRAAEIIAKELDQTDYDFDDEQIEIESQPEPTMNPSMSKPLSAPAGSKKVDKPSAVTGGEKAKIKNENRS